MCCGGIATEFNTQKRWPTAARCSCFHFQEEAHKHLLTCQAPTPH
jgi:hypothetical protein